MPGMFERDDWQAALTRWREAGLVDEDTESAVREWESAQSGASDGASVRQLSHGRIADVAAYLGASIVVIAWLLLTVALFDAGWGSFGITLAGGAVGVLTAKLAYNNRAAALSDASSGVAVLLVVVAVGFLLDEIGNGEQLWLGWLLISLVVAGMGVLMLRLTRSLLAIFAATFALAQAPAALAVGAGALDLGIYGGGSRSLDSWELWLTLTLVVLIGSALLFGVGRARRWLDHELAVWGRLGASLGVAFAILGLAGASTEPIIDWATILVGWAVTAWALRDGRAELLPASGVLLVGALVGGVSDVDDGARLGLTVVVLLTGIEATALGMVGPRLLGRLSDHWLTPLWQTALLGAGVVAAAMLAARSPELAAIGIVWAFFVLAAGVAYQHRIGFALGVIGSYGTLLTLIIAQFDSSVAGALGTLALGLLIVAAGIVWRRRFRVSTADSPAVP